MFGLIYWLNINTEQVHCLKMAPEPLVLFLKVLVDIKFFEQSIFFCQNICLLGKKVGHPSRHRLCLHFPIKIMQVIAPPSGQQCRGWGQNWRPENFHDWRFSLHWTFGWRKSWHFFQSWKQHYHHQVIQFNNHSC